MATTIGRFVEAIHISKGEELELGYSAKNQPVIAVGKEGNARGLALHEQLIYIADTANSCIQVVTFEGNFVTRFGKDILVWPWGIAMTEDHVFVTDAYLHALIKFIDYKVAKTGTMGKGEGELDNPYGVCIDYNGDVYVADCENNRVSVFSEELKFINHIGTHQLFSVYDVCVTTNSIVVLDNSPNCVHFYSRSGYLLKLCVSNGRDGMVCNPFFFCLDLAENILISDYCRHDIKILSPSGELIHTLGREGHKRGEFVYPFGICTYKLESIFVISQNVNFFLQSFILFNK